MSAIPKTAEPTARIYYLETWLRNHEDRGSRLYRKGYGAWVYQDSCARHDELMHEKGLCETCENPIAYTGDEDRGRV